MDDQICGIMIPASGLISGLIGAYVGLQNRHYRRRVRRELPELANRIITRINALTCAPANVICVNGTCMLAGKPKTSRIGAAG